MPLIALTLQSWREDWKSWTAESPSNADGGGSAELLNIPLNPGASTCSGRPEIRCLRKPSFSTPLPRERKSERLRERESERARNTCTRDYVCENAAASVEDLTRRWTGSPPPPASPAPLASALHPACCLLSRPRVQISVRSSLPGEEPAFEGPRSVHLLHFPACLP